MIHLLSLTRILAISALAAGLATAAPVSFFDTSFAAADWTSVILSGTNGAQVTILGPIPLGGNPINGQVANFFSPSTTGGTIASATTASINTFFQYNPATQGTLTSLTISFDIRGNGSSGFSSPTSLFYLPVLRQGGVVYLPSGSGTAPSSAATWQSLSVTGDLATAWTRSGANPDFSSAGGVIEFGYRAGLASSCPATSTTCGAATAGGALDNFSVLINQTSGNAVPEPSTALMLVGALSASVLGRFRRR